MNQKQQFVLNQAISLSQAGNTITGGQLGNLLNQNNLPTYYGTPYVGGRGVYSLIRSVYHELKSSGRQSDADIIADAFTNENGDYAYN